jgi:hypothetical protein
MASAQTIPPRSNRYVRRYTHVELWWRLFIAFGVGVVAGWTLHHSLSVSLSPARAAPIEERAVA